MIKWISFFSLLVFTSTAWSVPLKRTGTREVKESIVQQQSPERALAEANRFVSVHVGTKLVGNYASFGALSFGADYQHFFSEHFGWMAGADYTSRGINLPAGPTLASAWSNAPYLDLLAGLSYVSRSQSTFLPVSTQLTMNVGIFAAAALGDFAGDSEGTNRIRSRSFSGVFLDGQWRFPVSDKIALGIRVWTKLSLGNFSYLAATSGYHYDIGVGLLASYF